MRVGIITMDGWPVGVINLVTEDSIADDFVPDVSGYEPEGRADRSLAASPTVRTPHTPHRHNLAPAPKGSAPPSKPAPNKGESYPTPSNVPQRPFSQGSQDTDRAIVEAAKAHHLDPNFMRSVASIESGMTPSSNANKATQYKGLYQIGSRGPKSEWATFSKPGENIYSARDNAMAAARMFEANRNQFRSRIGRDPTDTEMYLMHQQGLGFYTRGAMTNIGGNPYPGMHGPQSHESFEAGWGREVARRKSGFASRASSANPSDNAPASSVDDHLNEPDQTK